MSELQAITIKVSNVEYTLRAAIDPAQLGMAVEKLNERIQNFKQKTQGDELRATVLAAISIATDQVDVELQLKDLQDQNATLERRLRLLSDYLGGELEKL